MFYTEVKQLKQLKAKKSIDETIDWKLYRESCDETHDFNNTRPKDIDKKSGLLKKYRGKFP